MDMVQLMLVLGVWWIVETVVIFLILKPLTRRLDSIESDQYNNNELVKQLEVDLNDYESSTRAEISRYTEEVSSVRSASESAMASYSGLEKLSIETSSSLLERVFELETLMKVMAQEKEEESLKKLANSSDVMTKTIKPIKKQKKTKKK